MDLDFTRVYTQNHAPSRGTEFAGGLTGDMRGKGNLRFGEMDPMASESNILLLIETSSGFTRRLIRGVSEFCNRQSRWNLQLDEGGPEMLGENWNRRKSSWRQESRPDGIIAHVESPAIWSELCETGLPLINVSGIDWGESVPWVDVNNRTVCRMVVDDFVGRGFKELAYCGVESIPWSQRRHRFFEHECGKRKVNCRARQLPGLALDLAEMRRLAEWLSSLPKPFAVMGCNDACARWVATACLHANLRVPDEAAIIGVDNDELVCELSEPTLSSVIPNTEKIGHAAAVVLDEILTHGRPVHPIPNIDPIGIESRHSTDAAAIGQDLIRLAMRFVHGHAHEGINVDDVLRSVPISRTALENGFRQMLGRTPLAELTRLRMLKARQLLTSTSLSLTEIASRVGYDRVDYFSTVFKREHGVSPSSFRKDASNS
ncbi:Xylose operon regulatory protein [Planctomycetes bacterium Pan216]|uniref:Xylose operon regulatory protein n=1 Tax=Kolteria novifilia TaxID=2527975 RepID=A0A518BBC9_9BACT|nr:Xylose operon regulatory protein [Planctomycetes bacterium Pan216]